MTDKKEPVIADAGEFGTIRAITHDLIMRPDLIEVGPGDDAAVYHVPEGYDEAISTDTMVEGIHFNSVTMNPSDVGYKLAMSNFSDICAMGGIPTGLVVSAALPKDLPLSWFTSCYDGIREACRKLHANMLGGDMTGTTKGIILTGTAVGMVPHGKAVTRGGARKGDLVAVTGIPGRSGAGLLALMNGWGNEFPDSVLGHRRPSPSPELASLIREAGATSMNDISDGLSSELNEIAAMSHVDIEIDRDKIPLTEEIQKISEKSGRDKFSFALNGGEDYELVFTIPEKGLEMLKNRPVTVIGQVTGEGSHVFLKENGKKLLLTPHGYHHFELQ